MAHPGFNRRQVILVVLFRDCHWLARAAEGPPNVEVTHDPCLAWMQVLEHPNLGGSEAEKPGGFWGSQPPRPPCRNHADGFFEPPLPSSNAFHGFQGSVVSLGGGWGSLVLVRHEQDHFARLCRSALDSFVTVCKAPAACSTTQPLTWCCVYKGAEYRPETLRLSC